MKFRNSERGAVAVELALVLPVLLLLVLGIMEFGRAYNVQISASQAAREGARYVAVNYSTAGFSAATARTTALSSAPGLPAGSTVTITYTSASGATVPVCTSGSRVKVTVADQLVWLTGYLPIAAPRVTGIGVMQCGG
ncbi:pilus assembly protein [Paenarthrobacter sp. Z7-10]|uniref:TadE/TadG family type IV pilus assembly protein n=1 Tax=Paenarthrobacter sp. Z7-10 TaxID=2787635 RepID=UPI0022A9CD98|nr:TadE/TadG family type IV pilus assembly protein [Paenarthrobacter sp. Z7-10]MCZ2403968.1 pilus assembly protein [Paenarthrobacter sp. Z7-10]